MMHTMKAFQALRRLEWSKSRGIVHPEKETRNAQYNSTLLEAGLRWAADYVCWLRRGLLGEQDTGRASVKQSARAVLVLPRAQNACLGELHVPRWHATIITAQVH